MPKINMLWKDVSKCLVLKPRGSQENIKHARQIEEHLRISTLPVGVKFYKRVKKYQMEWGKAGLQRDILPVRLPCTL